MINKVLASATFKKILGACFGFIMLSCKQEPQPQKPNPVRRKSPIAITHITYKPTHTYLKIVYGQPYKKGRDIFGRLVPYGKVWRTGANEATEMTATQPILLNGNKLAAGTYELFTIPKKKRWTIILNDSLGQWGAFDYNQKYDHLRTTVPAEEANQINESMTIQFSEITNNTTSIVIKWDTTKVNIPITFITADSAKAS